MPLGLCNSLFPPEKQTVLHDTPNKDKRIQADGKAYFNVIPQSEIKGGDRIRTAGLLPMSLGTRPRKFVREIATTPTRLSILG